MMHGRVCPCPNCRASAAAGWLWLVPAAGAVVVTVAAVAAVKHAWPVLVHAARPVALWMAGMAVVFGGVDVARRLVRGEPWVTGGRSSSRAAGGAVTGERARGGEH